MPKPRRFVLTSRGLKVWPGLRPISEIGRGLHCTASNASNYNFAILIQLFFHLCNPTHMKTKQKHKASSTSIPCPHWLLSWPSVYHPFDTLVELESPLETATQLLLQAKVRIDYIKNPYLKSSTWAKHCDSFIDHFLPFPKHIWMWCTALWEIKSIT